MKKEESQLLVIFGASGDLTHRKLIPSLCELFIRGLLPESFCVVGAARTPFSDQQFRDLQRPDLLENLQDKSCPPEHIDRFLKQIFYQPFDPAADDDYRKLKTRIQTLQQQFNLGDRIIYYLAVPPAMYQRIPAGLRQQGLNLHSQSDGWRRIIVEKPFGTDLDSASKLGEELSSIFPEQNIYRIDHYLGKETVQNILVLRFANGIFEPLWNRNYIDSIEISATETLGVENRGKYYDHAGALRDMIQNHLMQLMAFIAMENPAVFDPEPIRNEIVKVFRSLRRYSPEAIRHNVIRAQYSTPGYRQEADVNPDSSTETYVAMKLFIDNWRWSGVPFFIYTGKRLNEKRSEIVIHFKSTPTQIFTGQCSGDSCNRLTIRIQPDESISLKFGLKMPGAGFTVRQVAMDFRYDSLSSVYLPDAYERLLMDAMLGDSTLYARQDALEASWQFIDPILKEWSREPLHNLYAYPAGSNGPLERFMLLGTENNVSQDHLNGEALFCDL